MLNFRFEQKYHFVKLEKLVLFVFLSFMWMYSTDSY